MRVSFLFSVTHSPRGCCFWSLQNLGVRGNGGDPAFLKEMIENKFLGKKVGKGFFLYDKKGKRQGLNPDVAPLMAKYTEGRPDVCV